jgi:phosphoribosylformimino-5-aminoimidazole carboxamide ribotide isomerase
MTMQLIPSIDLLDGQVVRVLRGNSDAEAVYSDDPVGVARRFVDAGSPWIHVADFDAAREGRDVSLAAIEAICAVANVRVQSGGSVRSIEDARARFDAGVDRVVIRNATGQSCDLVTELAARYPGRVAVGLDSRSGDAASVGLARRYATIPGLGAVVVRSIDRDGTLEGPEVDQLREVLAAAPIPVVASGGVGSLDDLRELAAVRHADWGFSGAIVGRAIYEQRFTVEEGIVACSQSG